MAVGIDLGSSSIKIVEIRTGFGRARLIGAVRKRLGHLKSSEYSHVAAQLLSNGILEKLTGKQAILGVSGRDVNLQVQRFPSSGLTRYPSVIRTEIAARRGDAVDLYIDHATLFWPDQYSPFYLTAFGIARSEFIDERLAIARSMGVVPRNIVPAPFALMAAYSCAYPTESGVVLLLNIGAENTDVALLRGGRALFARTVNQGSRVFEEQIQSLSAVSNEEAEAQKIKFANLGAPPADQAGDAVRAAVRQGAFQLVGLVQSTLNYARTQLDMKDLVVDKVYLSGGGARIQGFDAYLKSSLKADVEFLDPFRNIATGPAERTEMTEIQTQPTDLAVAVGLAQLARYGARLPSISLLPERVREASQRRMRLPLLIGAAGILLVVLLYLTMSLRSQEQSLQQLVLRDEEAVSGLEKAQNDLDNLEARYRETFAKTDFLQNQVPGARMALEAYAKLRRLYREGIQIEKIEIQAPGNAKHAIVNTAERGHVFGTVQTDSDKTIALRGLAPVSRTEALVWEVPRFRVVVEGEIEETIKGGAQRVLEEMASQLADPPTGAEAHVTQDSSKKRSGWRMFSIEVSSP